MSNAAASAEPEQPLAERLFHVFEPEQQRPSQIASMSRRRFICDRCVVSCFSCAIIFGCLIYLLVKSNIDLEALLKLVSNSTILAAKYLSNSTLA